MLERPISMQKIGKFIVIYLVVTGLVGHLAVIGLYLSKPNLFAKFQLGASKRLGSIAAGSLFSDAIPVQLTLDEEIAKSFSSWQPLSPRSIPPSTIKNGEKSYQSLALAASELMSGDTLRIGEGIYHEAFVIGADHVFIEGNGRVIIENTTVDGKAAVINQGNNNQISNIECRGISVGDGNGACIRHEGQNLRLKHVYFHDSETGLLTGNNPGNVIIEDSRFEKLGYNGLAHGVYINGGVLVVKESLFLGTKSEGHGIKSRAQKTLIERSIFASLSSVDSRLVDISNGGILVVSDSILEKGPGSSNSDMIGYGLEGLRHASNEIALLNNVIIMERNGPDILIHQTGVAPLTRTKNNLVISDETIELEGFNLYFTSRKEANIEPYPVIPAMRH